MHPNSNPESTIHTLVANNLWRKVDKTGSCWLFTGQINEWGYGYVILAGRRVYTHRLAWMLEHGEIPDGMLVCHNCPDGDNPACCNPAHLYLGTPKQNMQDMARKGRGKSGGQPPKLSHAIAEEIRARYATGTTTSTRLGREYGVAQSTIMNVVHGKSWSLRTAELAGED